MPTTRQIRVITLLVECEVDTGELGPKVADRTYKMEGLNNMIVLSESVVADPLDVQATADAFERLAMRQTAEERHGKPPLYPHAKCKTVCQQALRGGCPVLCGKAMVKP